MRYRIIELQKDGSLKKYRVETRFLGFFWLRLRGDPRGKHGDIPGPLMWFDSAELADLWVREHLLKQGAYRSRVVMEVEAH